MTPYIILSILISIGLGAFVAARIAIPHAEDFDRRMLLTVALFAAGASLFIWILYSVGL